MSSPSIPADILLVAVNARFRHTAFGMLCLQANLREFQDRSELVEFTIKERPQEMLEAIVRRKPRIVGIGVYIWNVDVVTDLVAMLRAVLPDVVLVLGGPEVSYEWEGQRLEPLADHVIQGEGEQAFYGLCKDILEGGETPLPVIAGNTPPMAELVMPYALYRDEDIVNRVIYVEASRGCPYRCAFCLSSLDKRVRDVDLDVFFAELNTLWERGAREFKFIDRTFNLSIDFALRILDFFFEKDTAEMSLHFEMVPERLPEVLLTSLSRFPPGCIQLEVGVQTLSADVAKTIRRPMKIEKVCTNVAALHEHTSVHMHVDLIVGLPGEDMESFGAGLDRLYALGPHEIQVGILKRLKGTPIIAETETHHMVYSPVTPFEVMSTSTMPFEELVEMKRFARFWDLVINNGQLPSLSACLWKDQASVFVSFRAFSLWLYANAQQSSHISLMRLSSFLCDFLIEERGFTEEEVGPLVVADLERTAGRRIPKRFQVYEKARHEKPRAVQNRRSGQARQMRHH